MAVLIGFAAFGGGVFIPNIDLGSRTILGIIGISMVWAGLHFSKG